MNTAATGATCSTGRRFEAPLWLPWLAAPAFMLLPIGGCGVAESLGRHTARDSQPAPAPAVSSPAGTWTVASNRPTSGGSAWLPGTAAVP